MKRGPGWPRTKVAALVLALAALSCLMLPVYPMEAIAKPVKTNIVRVYSEKTAAGGDKGASAGLVSRGSGYADISSDADQPAYSTPCQDANQQMLAASSSWNASSSLYEASTLPRCMEEWSLEFLPAGATSYPPLTCLARAEWTKDCSKAGGLVVTVIAQADFANTLGEVSTRVFKFPSCVSSDKACTATANSADSVWAARLEQISNWCNSHMNPSLQCANVKVSTNFWVVVTWPGIIKILLGVLITLPSLAIITVIIFCYRKRRQKEHDEALERVELLRQARRSARNSQAPPPTTIPAHAAAAMPASSLSASSAPRKSLARTSIPTTPVKDPILPSMRPGETRPSIARTSASPDDGPML